MQRFRSDPLSVKSAENETNKNLNFRKQFLVKKIIYELHKIANFSLLKLFLKKINQK
jgi:hypothetical protein